MVQHPHVLAIARDVAAHRLLGRPPAHLVISGLTDDEADAVAGAFPLREAARRSADGWTAIHLRA